MVDRARAAAAIGEFLRALGRAPESDPELAQTARLVTDAWADELLIGYAMNPAEILSEGLSCRDSELVGLHDVVTTIMCPHHLLPASGTVNLVYAPGDRVVGLGALARLVTCFSRRLILQETLVQSIADALVEQLGARGAGCAAMLSPGCLNARGERCQTARALSVATAGEMREGGALRHVGIGFLLGAKPAVGG